MDQGKIRKVRAVKGVNHLYGFEGESEVRLLRKGLVKYFRREISYLGRT